MQKINRLGWTAGFVYTAFGVRIGIRSNAPTILNELRLRLPFGGRESTNSVVDTIFSIKIGKQDIRPGLKQYHLVYANFLQTARTFDLDNALAVFEQETQLYIAETARNRVFVHAGVVGWQGKAIVIPGASMSGKSTLIRELVKAGATYYSDEYALLDGKGRVHPYPLPIGVRTNIHEKQEKRPIEFFDGIKGTKPLPVGLVLATKYQPGSRWRPKKVSAGQGVLDLLSNTVSAQRNPAKALSALQQVVPRAPVLKGVRGEAEEVVDALLNKIRRKYKEYAINEKPFVVVKADNGTYGMGIMTVRDVKDLEALNRRTKNKMSVIKDGQKVSNVIIQEGVLTNERIHDAVAEPVVYMMDRYVVGGFYRVHAERGVDENLNAPGASFVPLAFAEPGTLAKPGEKPGMSAPNRFYMYGVIARLAMVAASYELEATDPDAEIYE